MARPDDSGANEAAERAAARFAPGTSWRRQRFAWLSHRTFRLWMNVLNRTQVVGLERFTAARATGRGLLTFSNHVSLFDDPLLSACFVGPDLGEMRWVAADALNFFGHPLTARLFSAGRAVPIIRGGGVEQSGMRYLVSRLADGDWVHLFPEGGRTRDSSCLLRTPLRPGLAHMVRNARPLLLPYVHQGMERVLPIGARVPRVGQRVHIQLGEVVDSDAGLADRSVDDLTSWAESALLELQQR